MSNKCNTTEALRRIRMLDNHINNMVIRYDKKAKKEDKNTEEYERVKSSLSNMVENIDRKAESVVTYNALIREAEKVSKKIEELSKQSPVLEAVTKRYTNKETGKVEFASMSNPQGVPLDQVVQIREPTVLNSVDINGSISGRTGKLLTETEEKIQAVLKTSGSAKNSRIFTSSARTHNPALNFFSKSLKEGEASNAANIVAAVRTSVDNYLVRNFTELSTPKDTREVAEMFDIDLSNMDESDRSIIANFTKGGSLASIEGYKLGQMMMENLGLKAAPNADIDSYNSLVSGFGQLGLLVMAELGYIKPYKVKNEIDLNQVKGNTSVVQSNNALEGTGKFARTSKGGQKVVENGVFINPSLSAKKVKEIENNIKELNDILDIPKESTLPVFEVPNSKKTEKIARQSFGKATNKAAKALKSLREVEHTVLDEPLELMVKAFLGENASLDNVTAENLLRSKEFREKAGIVDLVDDAGVPLVLSKNKRESIEAKNKAIADKINGLFMVRDEQKNNEGKGFFYDWFIARNHRLHMKSTVANPQDDKLFSRWFIQPKKVAVEANVADIQKSLEDPSTQVSMEADNFLYGLVQAFDGYGSMPNNEKVARERTINAARLLLDSDTVTEQKLMDIARNSEHLGHAFLAANNILKYRKAVENLDNSFISTMVREIDGKTNGFAHKVLQFPLGNYNELLKAVGIFTKDTKETTFTDSEGNTVTRELDSTADKVANKEIPDIYQLVAFETYRRFNAILGDRKDQFKNWLNKVVPSAKQDTYVFEDGKLNSAIDVGGSLRNFAKNPTTVSMYGALAYNAGRHKSEEITADILDEFTRNLDMSRVQELADVLENVLRSDQALGREKRISDSQSMELGQVVDGLRNVREEDLERLQRNLIEGYMEDPSNALLYRGVYGVIDYHYGQALEKALKSKLGPHEELMQTVNVSTQFIYDIFKQAYTKRKNEIISEKIEKGGTGTFTESDNNTVIEELLNLIPGIRAVDSEGLSDSGSFVKTSITNRDNLDKSESNTSNKEVRTKLDDDTSKGLKNMGLSGYIINHAMTVMIKSFSDPKASALPLSTHMLDAANLVRAISEANEKDNVVLPLHDAVVLGTGDISINKSLNRTFFDVNSEYSIMAQLTDRFAEAYKYALDNNIDVRADNYEVISSEGKKKISAEQIKNEMLSHTDKIVRERKKVFDQELIIGQFVGNKGTLYKSKGVITKDDTNTKLYKEGRDPFAYRVTEIKEKVDTAAFNEGESPLELGIRSVRGSVNSDMEAQLNLDMSTVAKYDCK